MIFPDEEVEGEVIPMTIGQIINSKVLPHVERAATLSKVTESPIETIMGIAVQDAFSDTDCEIIPQWEWRRYRADWAIKKPTGEIAVVECDGAEFHTSPDQVERDRRRDEEMLRAGIAVYRFTGSEIHQGAHHCAMRVKLEFYWGMR
jgi:very-short-patch-repair endonuclease